MLYIFFKQNINCSDRNFTSNWIHAKCHRRKSNRKKLILRAKLIKHTKIGILESLKNNTFPIMNCESLLVYFYVYISLYIFRYTRTTNEITQNENAEENSNMTKQRNENYEFSKRNYRQYNWKLKTKEKIVWWNSVINVIW